MDLHYSVIVIGGGHAGAEAAWSAANLLPGQRTVALVTLDPSKVGVMSCNPAIGGLAKGQLVREIDALGGLMALAADATGIQFRVLNQSKGPAVHGPRAQCDKHAYARAVQALIASRQEIHLVRGSVETLGAERGRIRSVGVATPSGELTLHADAVVLTTGTFMRGLMHTGESMTPGGRFGEGVSVGVSEALHALGFELTRLKTGTPPRLKRSSIRWDALEPQWGDQPPQPFSDLSGLGDPRLPHDATPSITCFPVLQQVECRQTRTDALAHDAIRANLHRAPMYSGQIRSAGPRYCPSIEDKVVRFAERDSHAVFLEPESLSDDWVYCNGISTSLPADVQDTIVRSMPGCDRAEIYRYGYAVEYDAVRSHQIHADAMTKPVEGLFLAGQINGTSGYEEAAAQGLIAGINAARFSRGLPGFTLGRDEAYIGVLMDDLVTKTPVEPYRMFTSRAEHRLTLRADNAPERLTPRAIELGLLDSTPIGRLRRSVYEQRRALAGEAEAAIDRTRAGDVPLAHLLRSDRFELDDMRRALGTDWIPPGAADRVLLGALRTVHARRRYEPYIQRQAGEIRRAGELEHRVIPGDFDPGSLDHLRTEAREALARFRPRTFGQASRLEGVTPSDVTLLAVLVERWKRARRSDE